MQLFLFLDQAQFMKSAKNTGKRSKYLQTTIIVSNSCKALNKQANVESELAIKIGINLFGDQNKCASLYNKISKLGFYWILLMCRFQKKKCVMNNPLLFKQFWIIDC